MFQASGMLGDQKRFWATEGVLFISERFTDLTEKISRSPFSCFENSNLKISSFSFCTPNDLSPLKTLQ